MIPTHLQAAKSPTGAATLAAFRASLQQAGDGAGGAGAPLPGAPALALPGQVNLILDPTEHGPALLEAVLEARTSLKLDAAWLLGPHGLDLLPAVARRARLGLRVQVLGVGLGHDELAALRAHGLVVRALPWQAAKAASLGRSLVADDRVAFVGGGVVAGAAVAALARISGEAAGELGRFFNHDWAAAGGVPLPLAPSGGFRASGTHALRSLVSLGGVGPARRGARAVLLAAISAATHELLVVADAVDDAELLAALTQAARRGVVVKLLLGAAEGLKAVARNAAVAALVGAGAELREASEGGIAAGVALRAIAMDGRSLVYCSAPLSALGLAGAAEVAFEARGGQSLELAAASLNLAFEKALPVAIPPSAWALAAPLAPALAALGARFSGAFNALAAGWKASGEMGVGVQHVPGAPPKLVARRLPPRPKAEAAPRR